MSADIIILPIVRAERPAGRRKRLPSVGINIGGTQRVSVRHATAAEVGLPLVELCVNGDVVSLHPKQAAEIGALLQEAAIKALA